MAQSSAGGAEGAGGSTHRPHLAARTARSVAQLSAQEKRTWVRMSASSLVTKYLYFPLPSERRPTSPSISTVLVRLQSRQQKLVFQMRNAIQGTGCLHNHWNHRSGKTMASCWETMCRNYRKLPFMTSAVWGTRAGNTQCLTVRWLQPARSTEVRTPPSVRDSTCCCQRNMYLLLFHLPNLKRVILNGRT